MNQSLTLLWVLVISLATACQPTDDSPLGRYRSAVTDGLNAELSEKETVLGINLGITDTAYFDWCTQLNRQQLITMGRGGTEADHLMETDLDRPAKLSFHPIFTQQNPRIVQALQTEFMYQDWSPWNKAAYADKLLPDVADYLSRTLATEFIELDHPQHGRTYAAVDGSRLVALWKVDHTSVRAMIADLSSLKGDPLGLVQ
ncbi:hypothetical protein GGR26_000934 [Lewinella marina]|uniref:Uncharacterized protein n=1 Tax=Neolewinella marina TaxID=438751 RepID=A0A2G0CIA2_9BACT|nr:hypothetical protein [Neolewinella marina]NJB85189.1 hypothetical protein [Neolewinella marina]PHK99678.1 hypothetical protein CGL56_01110 [Neolewinella marina]